ncbi:MAG: ATP-dependent DNA ligase [Gemmobacter sp.]
MRRFAALFAALDATTRTGAKVAALAAYFREAPAEDRVWTIALLSGRRPRRAANTAELRAWAAEASGIPDWLIAECHGVAGDLSETIARLLPEGGGAAAEEAGLAVWMGRLGALAGAPAETRRAAILGAWAELGGDERFLFNKLITGGFRMGVSQGLMTRALAEATGVEAATLAHRLTGAWDPETIDFAALVSGDGDATRPYPFCLAHPLEAPPNSLGDPGDWLAEWKWDGIRAQAIVRGGALHLWSRGEEAIAARFPEFAPLAAHLPEGTVIDGEVLAWDAAAGAPLPFASLQPRIGRKTVPRRLLAEAPARLLAYDLVEWGGQDIRDRPLSERRAMLAHLIAGLPADLPLGLSPEVGFADWATLAGLREGARDRRAEGLMLKARGSAYQAGRRRGAWWKWKLDPFSIDAVMVYAQAGHGRRATLYTDFTFALRDGNALVPVAKAYSGLTDAEFEEISRWVRANTEERFGPVRRVRAELVFELGFEGVQESGRHRSGVALRFPRMLRWRRDKRADQIDDVAALRALIPR